jgi:hypothetical protein
LKATIERRVLVSSVKTRRITNKASDDFLPDKLELIKVAAA